MSVLCSGSFVADIMAPNLPYIGPPGSLLYAPNGIMINPGGHSANVSIDLAQLGVKNVHAVGSIGQDLMGEFLVKQIGAADVIVHSEIHADTTTAKNIALLVKDEDRRFIAELTANSKLTSKFLMTILRQVKPMIYFQGTLGGLPNIEQDLIEILKIAKKLDAFRFLDVIMPSNGWEYLYPVISEIDLLHCNLDEGKNLTGLEKPKHMLETLLSLGAKGVIITDGANGLTAGSKDYIIDMPAFDVNQIDPTGAGDALCAGIIHFFKSTKESFYDLPYFTEALLFGQASGAACVTGIGATTNVQPNNINNVLRFKEDILKKTNIERR